MTTSAVLIQDAMDKVTNGEREVSLDFSSVLRIDGNVIREMEELADLADARSGVVVLRAVNVDVYRVLKQLKLADRFSF